MQSELKPCPFCGGEPHLMHCGAGTYMVQCLSCKTTTDDGSLDRISANWNRRSALVDVPAAIPTANCCVCGRIIDTREISQGGDNFGAETAPGKWTCSMECDDAVTGYIPDVPAVEPVAHIIEGLNGEDPRVYLTQKYDPRSPDFWLNEEARAKHRVTPLYTSPPPTREGEDSAEVLEALKEAVEFANKANNYIAGQDLPAAAGWLAVIAKVDAALAATRSGSTTTASGTSPIRQRGESDADQGN